MSRLLEGTRTLVTGANGGLGRAAAAVLEREGSTVVRVDLTGRDCVHHDLATPEGNTAMVDEAIEILGGLDVLVLNAGVQHMAPLAEFPLDRWDHLMNVLVRGPFVAIQRAWPHLVEAPAGRIVLVGSTLSVVGDPFKPAYVAAKHAAAGLIKVAAAEGGAHGLTANVIAPGLMMTPLIEDQMADQQRLHGTSRDEILAGWLGRVPAGRPVEAAEVAEMIAFLASERGSGVNGAVIPVDLGSLAQ